MKKKVKKNDAIPKKNTGGWLQNTAISHWFWCKKCQFSTKSVILIYHFNYSHCIGLQKSILFPFWLASGAKFIVSTGPYNAPPTGLFLDLFMKRNVLKNCNKCHVTTTKSSAKTRTKPERHKLLSTQLDAFDKLKLSLQSLTQVTKFWVQLFKSF